MEGGFDRQYMVRTVSYIRRIVLQAPVKLQLDYYTKEQLNMI